MNICSPALIFPLLNCSHWISKNEVEYSKKNVLKLKDWSLKIKPFLWNSKIVQNLSFQFQTEVLEFQQFNFEIQKIKFNFRTFLF